jgi:uncharacterized membrane protein
VTPRLGPGHAAAAPSVDRKGYLDWLRGIGVLIMIQGHVIDAWTAAGDRHRMAYHWISFVGGLAGAPIFLFLAGVALALAAGARIRRGHSASEVAALAGRRLKEHIRTTKLTKVTKNVIDKNLSWSS